MIRHGFLAALALASFGIVGAAQAGHYFTTMDGPSESPPNASPGTGAGVVDFDPLSHLMHIHADFSGLVGTTSASHIHSATAVAFTGTAGVATVTPTFTGFPLGVTSGTYDFTYDMSLASSYNPSFVTAHGGTGAGAEAFFFASMDAGKNYLNIHSSAFPGGEIRGFLVPEPGSVALIGASLIGLVARRRRA